MRIYKAKIERYTVKPKGKSPVKLSDLICGKCGNVLLGFDEDVCPSCGAVNSFDHIEGGTACAPRYWSETLQRHVTIPED